jgi:hypothetical protein
MLYHPSAFNPYGELDIQLEYQLTRREKFLKLIAWLLNMPLLWMLLGAFIATLINVHTFVEAIKAIDLVCK